MSKATVYDFNFASPAAVSRELYADVGASAFTLGNYGEAFSGGADFEIWTASSGGTQLTEGTDYTISQNNARGDTFYSNQAGVTLYSEITILNATYQSGNIYITYKDYGTYISASAFNSVIASGVPSGTVLPFMGSGSAPTGYLLCDGASYLRASYPDLFTAIGVLYGSADSTHFNVPDLAGKYLQGYESGVSEAIGTAQGSSAPNITGSVETAARGGDLMDLFINEAGAFDVIGHDGTGAGSGGSVAGLDYGLTIDASRSSSVYQTTTRIQTDNLAAQFIIKA